MDRSKLRNTAVVLASAALVAACSSSGSGSSSKSSQQPTGSSGGAAAASLKAKPELLQKALGSKDPSGVDPRILEAIARAGQDVPADRVQLAIKCWKDKSCDTGTGGKRTVALADGFGENAWREIVHMEFILQALTYPEIGKIVYTSAQGDTQKAISDFRSLIAQKVDVITTFPDAGEALLPTAREATKRGIQVVPYVSGLGGNAGRDYLTYVAEDLCDLGKNFADVLNREVGSGKIAMLGGTPGNPLTKSIQDCEKPALSPKLQSVGSTDTNWTQEGTLRAVSSILGKNPDVKGISYEYADGFVGGVRAYQTANKPINLVLTLRTDEVSLFCEWKKIHNPNFKIFHSSGGGFDSRIALTAAMQKLEGKDVPPRIVVPVKLQQVTDASCVSTLPPAAPLTTLVPSNVLDAMY